MNEYSKELCHFGIKLGAERKNHKYIARIETKPGKYLYFYDLNEYNAWKNGAKGKVKELGGKLKAKGQEAKSRLTPTVNEARSRVNSLTRTIAAKTANQRAKVTEAANKYSKYVTDKAEKVKSSAKSSIDAGKQQLFDAATLAKQKTAEKAERVKKNYDAGRNAVLQDARRATQTLSNMSRKAVSTGKNIALEKVSDIKTKASKSISDAKRFVNTKMPKTFNGSSNVNIKQAKNFVSHIAKSYVNTMENGVYDFINRREKHPMNAAVTKAPPGSDYLAEVKYPDGTTAKIKDKDQWKRFAETVKYQQNEQSFMHSIPEIHVRPDGTMPSKEEDYAEINEKRDNEDSKFRSVNCIYCSTAYELRRRGYDVEAADLPSTVTATNISDLYDMKDSTMVRRTVTIASKDQIGSASAYGTTKLVGATRDPDGSLRYQYEVSCTDLDNHDRNIKSFMPALGMKSGLNKASSNYAKDAEKAIDDAAKDFPNGSRGMINVYWQLGGGHSMVWEKDANGKITITDTQINEKIDIGEMMKSVDSFTPVMMIRTDDAKLSKKALTKIRSN